MRKLIAICGMLATVMVGCGEINEDPGSVESVAQGAPKPAVAAERAVPTLPQQADPRAVKAVTQENYPHLRINDPSVLPNPATLKMSPADLKRTETGNCYPPGHPGYQSSCVNPNYQQVSPGVYSHYGVDPYNGGGLYRYVYVVDEMAGTRASEWLAWLLNEYNANWQPANAARPFFYYFEASWLRAQHPDYANYYACNGSFNQFVEMCHGNDPSGRSSAGWSNYANGHVGTADMRIGFWSATCCNNPNDYYVNYGVVHEFGHVFGLAHTDECGSPMTYCSTVGGQYFFGYSWSDKAVLQQLYDFHGN